ncbi:peptidase M24 [Vararia minispora EC-137]|uniref:Peptidase M24 n=1 Tax=Vararia minispora EC-137 TaxID=1314806 RepID=A0ACB8QC24_9AGAM|nr:peptidase M24 [Vararia minispora EC-137]
MSLRSLLSQSRVLKPSAYGQPTPQSHPHLIQSGEVTPGIPAHEYERRRRMLMDDLPEGSVVLSLSAPVKYMSDAWSYKYRQASDFWYLTGFEEPNSAVVLRKSGGSRGYTMALYSTGHDTVREQWEGSFTSHVDIETIFGVDDARSIDDLATDLRKYISDASHVYFDLPPSISKRKSSGRSLLKLLQIGRSRTEVDMLLDNLPVSKRQSLAPLVGNLRAVKSKYEQAVMREAADISGRAHAKTMRFTEPGMSEGDLQAHFEYICARSGSQRPAYVPVVASGENALIIHYTKNHHLVRDGELVLMDAGCEYNGYASDISRTFPVSGRFTSPQAELYAAVLSAQKQLIDLCVAEDDVSMNDLHRRSVELLRVELSQIGFNLGAKTGVLERVLYPHYLTHPVGIDLHEATTYDRYKSIKEGMVLTIEPGIYVPHDDAFPSAFHGIGIRIEDEVLIGQHNPIVLSVAAPKEIVDVEGACQGALAFDAF